MLKYGILQKLSHIFQSSIKQFYNANLLTSGQVLLIIKIADFKTISSFATL